METERLYIDLDPDIQALVADNFINIEKALNRAGYNVKVELASQPERQANPSKEPATVLIATAAVILAATPVLREIIQAVSRRPIVLKRQRLFPVEDSKGNVIVGSDGLPVLQWVEVPDVVEAQSPIPQQQSVGIEGLGIRISYSTGESQPK
jgi:hypothetical protein